MPSRGRSSRRGPMTTPSADAPVARHAIRPLDRGADHGARRDLARPPASRQGIRAQRRRLRRRGPRRDGARIDHLVEEGLARRQGQRVVFARDLLDTLRRREFEEVAAKLLLRLGLPIARRRRRARLGHLSPARDARLRPVRYDRRWPWFQLAPWRPALEQQLGRRVTGVMAPGGNVDWSFGRNRGELEFD